MNNKSFYGLSLIALGMSMGQVAVAVEQKPEGSLKGAPLVFSIVISISIVIIERASQVLQAMATLKNGLMGLSVVLSLALHKAPSGSASMRLQW
jgi:hypothetical protein